MSKIYKGQYAVKFAREAKERPVDWLIRPVSGGFVLVYVGVPK